MQFFYSKYCTIYIHHSIKCNTSSVTTAIECERLPDIENGRVILSGTIVGSTATYSCSSGYILVGDRTRTCQSSGRWSGSEPFCKCKNYS